MQGGVLKYWHHLVVADAVLSHNQKGQKGTPAKISQTQTSNLFRAGGGGSWLLKLLLFCHY